MNIKIIADVVGSLFPIIFPKQEFKPMRLVAVVVSIAIAVGSVKYLGVDQTEQVLDIAEDIVDMTEE